MINGRYELTELTLLENLQNDVATLRVWTKEDITTLMVKEFNKGYSTSQPILIDEMPNMINEIPAVILYNQKSQNACSVTHVVAKSTKNARTLIHFATRS